MTAIAATAPLSLHSLLARLEASNCIAVVDHEFDEVPAFPWIGLEVGEFSLVVNMSVQDAYVALDTCDNQRLYGKPVATGWEQALFDFLTMLALAVEPA